MSTAQEFAAEVTVEALDRDPYPIYARLRDEAPVCLVPAVGLWFVTRWADVEDAATRPDVFAARVDPSPLERTMGGESILLLDGAPQKRLRTMLDPSLRPRVVEATTPDLIEPLVAELLDALAGRDEAELMSEYFEPVSVLGLGRVLGLGHLDGDTLRRWFHGLAEGAINFEDDPAKWEISDAVAAEIDVELAPVFERLDAEPDGSTIATMLELADGTLEERVATILPTLKVILLGGMQEPGHAAGSTLVGLLESRQIRAVDGRPDARARCDRGGPPLGLADRDPDAARSGRRRARRRLRPRRCKPRPARLVRQPRRGRLGTDGRRVRPLPSAAEPRGVRLRLALLLRPPLLPCADADRAHAVARAIPGAAPRHRPAARVRRLGVPRTAAPSRAARRMTWVDAADACRPDGTVVGAAVGDTLLALARVDGAWYAVEAWCTHAECPLTDGWVEGDALRCPCHGSLFELASGAVREGPADEPLRTYPTRVVDGRVEVEV